MKMLSMISNSFLISLLMMLDVCGGSSILAFFPAAQPSHHQAFQPIIRGLLDRGHKLTYFSPVGLSNPPEDRTNYTEIRIKDLMLDIRKKFAELKGINEEEVKFQDMWFPQQQFGLVLGRLTFEDEVFKDFINSDLKFDCILYSGSFMQEMYSALSHRFQAPLIEVLPAGNFHYTYWLHGNPYDTSYIVEFGLGCGDRMSLLERMENTIESLVLRVAWYLYYRPQYQALMNQLFRYPGWETRPSMEELVGNTSMVLMNTHYSLNYPYPLSPNFKEIGGINIVQPKSLPKDLQDYMNSAKEGVIYFSLGSHISVLSTLGEESLQAFVKAFAQIKQKVLWKTGETIPNLSSNVVTGKWFPQQAILNHKNCKIFITHGGFLSLSEAVNYGVPMIGTPVMADQLKNIRHMEINGYGVQLKLSNITFESILWAINEILENPKYNQRIQKQSELFRDKPETALETAVYWTEYVIRHKGAHHLKPAIATMPWYQQAMIDVYITIALIISIPLYVTYTILKCMCSCLRSSSKKTTKKKKE